MIQYTRTYTRPTTMIPWWFNTTLSVPIADFHARMQSVYYATGKCISQNFSHSVDELTLTYTGLWESEAAYDEYDTDAILSLYWAAKDEYSLANGIVKGQLVITPL